MKIYLKLHEKSQDWDRINSRKRRLWYKIFWIVLILIFSIMVHEEIVLPGMVEYDKGFLLGIIFFLVFLLIDYLYKIKNNDEILANLIELDENNL